MAAAGIEKKETVAGTEKKETNSLEMMRKFSEQYAKRCCAVSVAPHCKADPAGL